MKIVNNDTPVLVLECEFAGIGIMRSLGSQGVKVYGVEPDPRAWSLRSRYCVRHWIREFDAERSQEYLDFLMEISKEIGTPAVLIPTTDALAVFVAENRDTLKQSYLFADNDPELVHRLVDKRTMSRVASEHGVPTPALHIPSDLDDLKRFVEDATFPLMMKGICGVLDERTDVRMMIVETPDELIRWYNKLENPAEPNIMIQEYIPGGDDDVYIFNGYFDRDSKCLAAFTGHKIRQYPIHRGCASLGRCSRNDTVAGMTIELMQRIGYSGILDIGYRLDHRDGSYQVLDINPRIGGAFRMFVDERGGDVVRALYNDLTGQEVVAGRPREGRKWMIEEYDIKSSHAYYCEGTLSFGGWLRSLAGIQETKWFSWRDPMPFVRLVRSLIGDGFHWLGRKLRPGRRTSALGDIR